MPRRRRPLVCQHIENLSSEALERYADIIRDIVGRRFGVYALYRRDRLYYVGLAINLRNRLKAHLKDRHKGLWDRFSVYLTIEDGHIKELESLVIRIAQPKGNKHSGKFARSENLMRELRKRFRERQAAEWLSLIGGDLELDDEVEDVVVPPKRKGRAAVLANYVSRAMALRVKYKGKVYKARVRKNGTIRVGGMVYTSPSLAGHAVAGRPINGWQFWKYERAPGQWVKLQELRRR